VRWRLSWRADPAARVVADRHYNRQAVGAAPFVPPGRCLVLRTADAGALWVTSWPLAEYVQHRWAGAWVNSLFRNERRDLYLSSELIREAVAATRWRWPITPTLGMVSFVDPEEVRHKRDPGRCYRKAGFELDGETDGGLLAWRLRPERMPQPSPPLGAQSLLVLA
jgi:hypothetical protein